MYKGTTNALYIRLHTSTSLQEQMDMLKNN